MSCASGFRATNHLKLTFQRFIFLDKQIADYLGLATWLGTDSDLVHNEYFENAITKIQRACDQGKAKVALTKEERYSVAINALDTN